MTTSDSTSGKPDETQDVVMQDETADSTTRRTRIRSNISRKRNHNGTLVNAAATTTTNASPTNKRQTIKDADDHGDDEEVPEFEEAEEAQGSSDFDKTDSEDEDDEELNYYESMYGSAGLFYFSSTNARVEKLAPIVLRACNMDANWSSKELHQLREELRRCYETTHRRAKLIKRDYRRHKDYEQDKGMYYVPRGKKRFSKKGSPLFAKTTGSKQKPKICGVVNSRGKPCQRTGFCPFHHKITARSSARSRNPDSSVDDSTSHHVVLVTEPDQAISSPFLDQKTRMKLARTKTDKELHMQFSVLLIAAAAIERQEVDQQAADEDKAAQLQRLSTTTTPANSLPQQSSDNNSSNVPPVTSITAYTAQMPVTPSSSLSSLLPSSVLVSAPPSIIKTLESNESIHNPFESGVRHGPLPTQTPFFASMNPSMTSNPSLPAQTNPSSNNAVFPSLLSSMPPPTMSSLHHHIQQQQSQHTFFPSPPSLQPASSVPSPSLPPQPQHNASNSFLGMPNGPMIPSIEHLKLLQPSSHDSLAQQQHQQQPTSTLPSFGAIQNITEQLVRHSPPPSLLSLPAAFGHQQLPPSSSSPTTQSNQQQVAFATKHS